MPGIAVVTGASSGIGAAVAHALSARGYDVVAGARRQDRLAAVAAAAPGPGVVTALPLDVTSTASVAAFAERVPSCDVLVNNAGGALGMETVAAADEEHWRSMYETNVLGTMRVTRALLPALTAAPAGHVVVVGSVAGIQTYDGGGGYTAAKHAEHALAETLRGELNGTSVKVTEIAPGLVETDFSLVRLGSREAADKVYAGLTPLTAADVADVVAYAVTRPPHVVLGFVTLLPVAQASATRVTRSI